MRHSILLFAAAAVLACTNPKYACSTDADCPAGTKCDPSQNLCGIPGGCTQICKSNESCISAVCVAQGPGVNTVVVTPSIWSPRSQQFTVTAVVDGTGGPGIATASLQIAGRVFAGTSGDTGLVRTYSFSVQGSVQASGSETPVSFAIVGTDTAGHTTPSQAAGTGQLLIDDKQPHLVSGVVVKGTAGAGGLQWFKRATTGNIDVATSIQDSGSGVNTSKLSLKLLDTTTVPAKLTTTPLDTGGPPVCAPGAAKDIVDCHFSVPLNYIPAGTQKRLDFYVDAVDMVGNPILANSAALGIDDQGPTITFTIGSSGSTAQYPATGANCNNSVVDPNLFCGHDGGHFWRRGEPAATKLIFTVTDVGGSGASTVAGSATYFFTSKATGMCSVATPCNATFVSGNSFSILADFSGAPFTSGADGTGIVSVSVSGQDVVGNAATPVALGINVTRVKWMRSMAGKVIKFIASPIATTQPVAQVILGGAEGGDNLGPIASFALDGSSLWRAAHNDVDTIVANMAYSSATNYLYVAAEQSSIANSSNKLFFYHINSSGLDTANDYNCPLLNGGLSGKVSGSPSLLSATGTEYALIADQTQLRLFAMNVVAGIGCSQGTPTNGVLTGNPTAWTITVLTPSVNGSTIYVPHGNSGLGKVTFSSGSFTADTEAPSAVPAVFGEVSIAGNLFFGERGSLTPKYYAYDATALTPVSKWPSAQLAAAVTAPAIVSASYVFGSAGSGDAALHAFTKNDPSVGFTFSTGTTGTPSALGALSPVALGADSVIYFSDDKQKAFYAVAVPGSGSTASLAPGWAAYQGSSGTSLDTTIDSMTTEATLDSSGVAYFGTAAGKVFAIITDSSGPLAPSAGTTWPRVGYDNCNSGNTAFSCQ